MTDQEDRRQDKPGDVGWEQADLVEGTSLWRDAFRRLIQNRAAMTGLIVVSIMGLAAIFFEPISTYVTQFDLDEQHPFIEPKPPMSRSVPSEHFDLMAPDGDYAFEDVDRDGDGEIGVQDLQWTYRQMEFETIDTDGDGTLTYEEYQGAPLSMEPTSDNIPTCDEWERLKDSLAALEHPRVFRCQAGEDEKMTIEESGEVADMISSREAESLIGQFDRNGDGVLSEVEYAGLPAPQTHYLGTDQLGRDLLTRLVYGARISLSVGLLAALVSFFIGVTWGATAGFLGGVVDNIMMRIVDVMYGLPFMILVILLISVFGQSMLLLFIAIGAIRWLTMARIVRGQVISLKEEEFIEAAECIGVSKAGIIFKHLIPNALGPIIVYTTLMVPSVMLAEAFLSFLGLGIRAPYTSWGLLASEGREVMGSAPWIIISSGLALAVTLLSLNFLGDGLRDALDPQLKDE